MLEEMEWIWLVFPPVVAEVEGDSVGVGPTLSALWFFSSLYTDK